MDTVEVQRLNENDESARVTTQEAIDPEAGNKPKTDKYMFVALTVLCMAFVASTTWAIVMTVRYDKCNDDDTTIRGDGPLGIAALSHINVVVNDSVEIATEYYKRTLGFDETAQDFSDVQIATFCIDAGLPTNCSLDIRFLQQPITRVVMELMYYHYPKGDQTIPIHNTTDVGGIRHTAWVVRNASAAYEELQHMDHQGIFLVKQDPVYLTPDYSTIKFFYWIDKYGVQWEFEEGRQVKYYEVAGSIGWNEIL